MSTGRSSARHHSRSSISGTSAVSSVKHAPPTLGPIPTLTPENADEGLLPCAATSKLFLVAQGPVILCLRHETLAIERRFDKHKQDVAWISVDNVSERHGKLVVSYDIDHNAIIWDVWTGNEHARFAAFEPIRVAAWMRNGNIAFGNTTGNIIIFDTTTSEHHSVRTIYDPITALAPSADCRIFAIGYITGSILICTLDPTFAVLHTLNTQKAPARVTSLGWHGSNAKAKTDMLATQTANGDLRVWSVPKAGSESSNCTIIRTLSTPEGIASGPTWCAWSRGGRIIQHADGQSRLHDVRTKHVAIMRLSTPEGITGIATHGPSSALMVVTKNHLTQQWNINPEGVPFLVRDALHLPAKPPPSPPGSVTSASGPGNILPSARSNMTDSETSGAEDANKMLSPMQRITNELNDLEAAKEGRDRLTPLSPGSSRSSLSSGTKSPNSRRLPAYMYDKPPSRNSVHSRDSTEFSIGQSLPRPRGSGSIRTTSASFRSSTLRREASRSSINHDAEVVELFPFTKARLQNIKICSPDYGDGPRTPDVLRKEMLRVVFGWNDDVKPLIRDEMMRHAPGSSRAVLLAKWLGELGSDFLVSMMGSENLTSSDWMLVALGSIGKDSQRKVGEAFVQRLLEKSDVHAAVAVLLGLNEFDDAIETYVSQSFYPEALLLTCLTAPTDWGRQTVLLHKWAEVAIRGGMPELAVRLFSCASVETSATWSSPRAKRAVKLAQKEQGMDTSSTSPPVSPPSAGPHRMTAKNASLKLITSFGEKGLPLPQANPKSMDPKDRAFTPIAQSALSPGGQSIWARETRKEREPGSARSTKTATPGGYARKRQPSLQRSRTPNDPTPQTTTRDFAVPQLPVAKKRSDAASSTASSQFESSGNEKRYNDTEHLPSPGVDAVSRMRKHSHIRNGSRDRMPDGLHLTMVDSRSQDDLISPPLLTNSTNQSGLSQYSAHTLRSETVSPTLSGTGSGVHGRSGDTYISSLEQARYHARQRRREESQSRTESRTRRRRDRSESRGRHEVAPAKRSPSMPIPMSPEEVLAATKTRMPGRETPTAQVEMMRSKTPADTDRGRVRLEDTKQTSAARSPSAPARVVPVETAERPAQQQTNDTRPRFRSISRGARSASLSRIKTVSDLHSSAVRQDSAVHLNPIESEAEGEQEDNQEGGDLNTRKGILIKKKEEAAKELDDQRQASTRRPSVPSGTLPRTEVSKRPALPQYHSERTESPTSLLPAMTFDPGHGRSKSVDPESQMKAQRTAKAPGQPPKVGLPATPRALMHQRFMFSDAASTDTPPVPPVPPIPARVDSKDPGFSSDDDNLGPLLPSSTYGGPAPDMRAASAPIDQGSGSTRRAGKSSSPVIFRDNVFNQGHARPLQTTVPQRSPPIVTASIDETIHDSQVTVETVQDPPLLPQLQHLADPPPPPPVPPMPTASPRTSAEKPRGSFDSSPVISRGPTPILPAERAVTSSPTAHHRRGRGSISETKGQGIGSRIRNAVTERMRSTSRSNNKSPPISGPMSAGGATQSPYETVLPSFPPTISVRTHSRRGSVTSLRTKSPYEAGLSRTNTAPVLPTASAVDVVGASLRQDPALRSGNPTSGPMQLPSRPSTAPPEQARHHHQQQPLPQGQYHPPQQASYVNASLPPSRTVVVGSSSSSNHANIHPAQRPQVVQGAGYTPTPREVRANMSPELLKASVYVPALDTREVTLRQGQQSTGDGDADNVDGMPKSTFSATSASTAGGGGGGGGGGDLGGSGAGSGTRSAGAVGSAPAAFGGGGGKLRKVNPQDLLRSRAAAQEETF